MKKQSLIFICILSFVFTQIAVAQNVAEVVVKTKTKSNPSNDRSSVQNDESRIVKIRTTANGCEIVFNQAIVSPRDAASGLPTGKRQHKPFVITKEIDKSSPLMAKSGGGTGKVSVQDISVTFTSKGRTQKLTVTNGTFLMPEDCDDDDCDMVVSWSWGMSNSGISRCEVPIKVSMQNGACLTIREKGTGATNR